jgi:arylformamidase
MVATSLHSLYHKAPPNLAPAGYAVSGLFDLAPLIGLTMNQDLRLDAAEARRMSPLFWPVAPGRVLDAGVGDGESDEFKRQSRTLAQTWRQAGAATRYQELPGNHFTVIAPLADPQSAMVARLAELAQAVKP